MIDYYTNDSILKGSCVKWKERTDFMQRSGLALSKTDAKNEAFCKLYCIKNFPECVSLDWDAESGCTVHYTGAYGPLLFSSGTIHWKLETVQCEGMISGICNVKYTIYY